MLTGAPAPIVKVMILSTNPAIVLAANAVNLLLMVERALGTGALN